MARKRKNRTHLKGAHKDEKDVRPPFLRRETPPHSWKGLCVQLLTRSVMDVRQDKTPKSFVIKVREGILVGTWTRDGSQ